MRLVRTVLGTDESFSHRLITHAVDGPLQGEEDVSMYLGRRGRQHYWLHMTPAEADDLAGRLQNALARQKVPPNDR